MDIEHQNFPFKEETHTIIGVCMEVHRILGKGLVEIVYKDAVEYEFQVKRILYEREKEYAVRYKEIILPHKFYADFVVDDSIILEAKAEKSLASEHYAQMINYLRISGCKVGLLVNFGESSLKWERFVL